jgi:hypothetical protein
MVPELIDRVFAKNEPECSFSMTVNERFGLVFAKHGSINSARQCLASTCHFSELLTNTGGLAYPYDWRGFVEAKKKTSVGLSVFNSSIIVTYCGTQLYQD